MDGRADRGEVAELSLPLLGGDAADPFDGGQHELADCCRRRGSWRSRPDQPAELVLDLLVAVGDQLLLGLEVVVDGLFETSASRATSLTATCS